MQREKAAKRQQKRREKVVNDPELHQQLKEKDKKRKTKKQITTRRNILDDAFSSAFELSSSSLEQGLFLQVNNFIQLKQSDVIAFKHHLQGCRWYTLKDPKRAYMSNPPRNLTIPSAIKDIEALLCRIFTDKVRLDGKHWHVNETGYIKHSKGLIDRQGFHMDVGSDYDYISNLTTPKHELKYDNFGGFSVFLGLDRMNYLEIGELRGTTIHARLIEFPFNSIVIISSYKLHSGWKFMGDTTIFASKTTDFSLKGFISISKYTDGEDKRLQRWFRDAEINSSN